MRHSARYLAAALLFAATVSFTACAKPTDDANADPEPGEKDEVAQTDDKMNQASDDTSPVKSSEKAASPTSDTTGETQEGETNPMTTEQETMVADFGKLPSGETAKLYMLANTDGVVAKITDYGATIVALEVPDKDGERKSVVLGYDTLEGYVEDTNYFGCTVGRYANRIAEGKFTLEGEAYELATNNEPNHLHGGKEGFNKKLWKADEIITHEGSKILRMKYVSPDGEEGYPGEVEATVTFTLTPDNALVIDYKATTTEPTHVNLTNHSYFNLGGHDSGDVLDQVLLINADKFTPTDDTLIPTGELKDVQGTPMDFRKPKPIGQDIKEEEGLYDVNFVVNEAQDESITPHVTQAMDPESGRRMDIYSTEPGVQLYTADHLDGVEGRGGATYDKHQAFCLETQHFPDTPNQADFPSTLLRPDETYESTTVHLFSWE